MKIVKDCPTVKPGLDKHPVLMWPNDDLRPMMPEQVFSPPDPNEPDPRLETWTWVTGLEHIPEEEMEEIPSLREWLSMRDELPATVTNPRIVEPAAEPQNVE